MTKKYECRFSSQREDENQNESTWQNPFRGFVKSINALAVVMLFLIGGQQMFSQIIVESGAIIANFGIDGDVQANESRYIYVNGVLQVPSYGANTDDWFNNGPANGSGVGVIDISGGNPITGPNSGFAVRMAEDHFYIDSNNKMWVDAAYVRDPNSAGSNQDFSVFGGGSNKNADNPGSWNIVSGSTPQKNDIIDVFAHLRRDGPSFDDDLYAFIGASTRSGDGSAYLDIEFYRNSLEYVIGTPDLSNTGSDGGHTSWQFDNTANIIQIGDAIVSLDFENGGAEIDGNIYIWVRPSDLPGGSIISANTAILNNPNTPFIFVIGGNGQPVFESGTNTNGYGYAEIELKTPGATPIAFASINAGPVLAGPWQTLTGPQASQVADFPELTFVEFGVNLTAIGLDQSTVNGAECGPLFGGVIIKTRSSASFTSELKDLAGPFPFGNVEVTVTITGEDLECNAASVTLYANTPVQAGLQFKWYKDGILIPGEGTFQLIVAEAGVYKCIVTTPGIGGPGTGCSSEDEFTVNEIIPPAIVVNCPENEIITACLSQSAIDAALSAWFAQFSASGGQGVLTEVYEVYNNVTELWEIIDPSTYLLPAIDACDGGSVTIRLTATDECDYEASCTSTFSVAGDNEAPTLVGTVPSGQTDLNLCFADIPVGPSEEDIEALFTDNCGSFTVTKTGTPSGDDCNWTVTYNYTIIDACGNEAEEINITYSGGDSEAPTLVGTVPDGQTNLNLCFADIPAGPSAADIAALFTDNCGDVNVTKSGSPTGDDCSWSVTYTYTIEDDCENFAAPINITYSGGDTQAPLLVGTVPSGETNLNLCFADIPAGPSAAAIATLFTDNCGGVNVTKSGTPTGDDCSWSVTYTYTIEDDCENFAAPIHITYSGGDTEDPVIINLPVVDLSCYGEFPLSLSADWTDNCAAGGEVVAYPSNIQSFECYETADYVFYVEDDCENSAEETVTVTRGVNEYNNCETAFGLLAGSERCFLQDGYNRWGWTNQIVQNGTYTLDLYAGAGRCRLSSGTQVGIATVVYSGGQVSVSIDIFNGYAMSEAHIFIGCDMYPLNNGTPTVAPGQYPYNWGSLDYVNNYSMAPVSVSGPFWIIVHTVVCEAVCVCAESTQSGGEFIPSNNEIFCGESRVETTSKIDFNAYPVPYESKLNIDYTFEFDTNVTIEVFDIRGRLIGTVENFNYSQGSLDTSIIDMSRANDQVYFIKLTTDRGVVVKKVVSSSK